MIMTIMKIKLNMVIMMINIRCVHLALMISLCFSSIINAMYLVALDTIIIIIIIIIIIKVVCLVCSLDTINHTILIIINFDQVTFDAINDISDVIIIKCVRISSIGLSFSFVCLQMVYRVKTSTFFNFYF